METLDKSPKISKIFFCENCDYKCCKQSEYNKHILTNKHKILQDQSSKIAEKIYTCNCGKVYKHSSTLYAHKKKCNTVSVADSNAVSIDKDQLIMLLIKQNADLIKETTEIKNIMKEVLNQGSDLLSQGSILLTKVPDSL